MCSMEKAVIHICRYTAEILSIQEFQIYNYYLCVFQIMLGRSNFHRWHGKVYGYDMKLLSELNGTSE